MLVKHGEGKYTLTFLFAESRIKVGNYVFNVFNSDRKTDKIGRNTAGIKLLVGKLPVSGRRGMQNTGAGVGYMSYDSGKLQRIMNLVAASRPPLIPKLITPEVPFGIYFARAHNICLI